MSEPKTKVRRQVKNTVSDRDQLYRDIDAALLCHVAFVQDDVPYCIPIAFVRIDDAIYVHGSIAARILRVLGDGAHCAVSFTHMDGLVLARSVFNHSMNYRSVCVYGHGRVVEGEKKLEVLEKITEAIAPGQWAYARQPSEDEMRQTLVIEIPIEHISGKTRQGPPNDDADDMELGVWAGVVPMEIRYGEPIASPDLGEIEVPTHVRALKI